MTTYTTNHGDMWDAIAKKTMGAEMYANQLIDANQRYSNIVKFDAGVILIIPEIVTSKSAVNLPPWKQRG
jgi:phage tail protein X